MKREIKSIRHNRRERGSTTFEAIMAIVILFLIVFSMLQIYHWCMSRQICQYSAFFTNKWVSLGYHDELALRAAKVAAIPICGRSVGAGKDDEDSAEQYMIDGDNSGVQYEYWHPRNKTFDNVNLAVYRTSNPKSTYITTMVKLENAPLLNPNLAKLLSIRKAPDPKASVDGYNYSKEYLEE